MCLYQAVAVEENSFLLSEDGFYFLIAHLGHKPKGHPPSPQFLSLVSTIPQGGQVVSCIGVSQGTTLEVEVGVEAGHFFA
jgi:fatty acid-binding protein DegV